MRLKLIISVLLLLAGTNLFTYSTTKQLTTAEVLIAAEKRTLEVVKAAEAFPLLFPDGQIPGSDFSTAIAQAGGMYYGINEVQGAKYTGVMFVGIGLLLPFVRLRTPPRPVDVTSERR